MLCVRVKRHIEQLLNCVQRMVDCSVSPGENLISKKILALLAFEEIFIFVSEINRFSPACFFESGSERCKLFLLFVSCLSLALSISSYCTAFSGLGLNLFLDFNVRFTQSKNAFQISIGFKVSGRMNTKTAA